MPELTLDRESYMLDFALAAFSLTTCGTHSSNSMHNRSVLLLLYSVTGQCIQTIVLNMHTEIDAVIL